MKPNPLLTMDCDRPELQTEHPTYRDVVRLADQRGEALKECTARMRVLRDQK